MLKKIDKYLTISFLPPFFLMFGIALFAFVMQFLWLYVDEIMGKGADLLTLTELIGYLSVTFFPTSLPVGVLVASVMVMGNLAERYELSSFKSAGVSLTRTMRPLMIVCLLVSAFSFLCSNTLIPLSNLKFQSRFYDLRRSKPVLSLEAGVFNDAFNGFTIRIGSKESDEQTIHDVLIYDNSSAGYGKYNMIYAANGTMRMTPDKQFMVMALSDGYQIQEMTESKRGRDAKPQFMRSSFKEWQKVFDLSEFVSGDSDESIFSKGQKTQNTKELMYAIDTLDIKANARRNSFYEQMYQYFSVLPGPQANRKIAPAVKNNAINDTLFKRQQFLMDSLKAVYGTKRTKQKRMTSPSLAQIPDDVAMYSPDNRGNQLNIPKYANSSLLKVAKLADLDTLSKDQRIKIIEKALSNCKNVKESALSVEAGIYSLRKTRDNFQYELHQKFSLALACFIFLFIGAPMGAIVRKGGFGWPLLIAIMFFALFIVLNLMGKSFVKSGAFSALTSAWLPVYVFVPIGFFLTYGALHDYTIQNLWEFFRPVLKPFVWLFDRIKAFVFSKFRRV